jgi:dipeptidyl aminopeptidase/acylaminoacyl peptidase
MLTSLAIVATSALLLRSLVHAMILRALAAPRLAHQLTPAELGLNAQALRLPTAQGKTLFAWFVRAPGPPRPALVLMHGWGANASLMLTAALPLNAAGFSVLLLDARCHGASDSDVFSSLPRFAQDIESGLDWLGVQPDVDPHRLAVIGHSVGAGAALLCATRRNDLQAVVSISAFAHPREMMRRLLDQHRIPYPVVGWYVMRHVERVIGARFNEIAPLTSMASLRCPVLLLHGRDDNTVPFTDARRLQDAALPAIVPCLSIRGGHDPRDALPEHFDQVVEFLQAAFFSEALRYQGMQETPPAASPATGRRNALT